MLRPRDIRQNLDNFNSVVRDAIERMVAIRREDDVLPNLEGELAKYATECKRGYLDSIAYLYLDGGAFYILLLNVSDKHPRKCHFSVLNLFGNLSVFFKQASKL